VGEVAAAALEEVALLDQAGEAAAAGRAGPAVGAKGLPSKARGGDDAGLEVEEIGFDGGAVRHGGLRG
jgi:hypothetical protein